MVSYIFIYVASMSVSLSGSCVVWRGQRKILGLFFLLLTLSASLHLALFFLPYILLLTDEILPYVSRFLFWENSTYTFVYGSIFPVHIFQFLISFVGKIQQMKYSGHNELIDRQNEFIGVISHEIKTPISSAILQSESIIDDINSGDISQNQLKNEIVLLNTQLVRTGELLSKLFSIQYYDTREAVLTREKVSLSEFIDCEFEYYREIHKEISFLIKKSQYMDYLYIDRVQFRQVITNLVENAIKFIEVEKPIIAITLRKIGSYIELTIEDNGKGFHGIAVTDLFDKYTIGKEKAIGMGMGLYLCKKIIGLHNGTIEASISEKYQGAKFTILLPMEGL